MASIKHNIKAKVVQESDETLRAYNWTHPFKLGDLLYVDEIRIGQTITMVSLVNHKGFFNSLLFEFYENDEPIDIFEDERFNPYI